MSDFVRACPSCDAPTEALAKFCAQCGQGLPSMLNDGADPLCGRLLPGGYRIVEFIAEGSMGRVYRAEQATLGRAVAVKIMNASLLARPQMVERFSTEARAASMLSHPNCVRVFDFGEMGDGRPYLVMELLEGKDLEIVLRDTPKLPIPRVLDIVIQVLAALQEAHEQGIIHRDLKPANVFLHPQRGGGDLVKVVDFGLAKLKSAISASSMTGIVCGTPGYMAPEQATAEETDARTDIYACGVMLYELVAGVPPFSGDDPTELLQRQVYDAHPPLSSVAGDRVLPGLEEIVDKAMQKDKSGRFDSALAFSEALQAIVAARTGERVRSWVRMAHRACPTCHSLAPLAARYCGECGGPMPSESAPPRSGAEAFDSSVRGDAPTPSLEPILGVLERIMAEHADAAMRLVALETLATTRLTSADVGGAVIALETAVKIVNDDVDRGELDDPMAAMALFSGKLGAALLVAGEYVRAEKALSEALALPTTARERSHLLRSMSRVQAVLGNIRAAERFAVEASRAGNGEVDPPRTAPIPTLDDPGRESGFVERGEGFDARGTSRVPVK